MNNENLRRLTPSEARKIGRLGGLASGESRRKKRQLRGILEALLYETEVEMKDDSGETLTMSAAEGIAVKLIEEALNGNVKAFTVIRDTIGEMPTQKVQVSEVDPSVIEEIEKIVNETDD